MDTIVQYGWPILFAWVFADQVGIPVPVVPLQLGAGALAGGQRLSLSAAIALAVAATLLADLAWYALGRRHSTRALGILCRITLEPDSCVRRAQQLFLQYRRLMITKFLPGVNPLAAGLAGAVGVGLARFVAYDLGSAVISAGTSTVLGYVMRRHCAGGGLGIRDRPRCHSASGHRSGCLRCDQVRQASPFPPPARMARISPAEVQRRVDAGEHPMIVDLRTALEESVDPYTIPGALRMAPEDLEDRHREIPRDVEIVRLCS